MIETEKLAEPTIKLVPEDKKKHGFVDHPFFIVGLLLLALIASGAILWWAYRTSPSIFVWSDPLSIVTTISKLIGPVAVIWVMASLTVQWATHRSSSQMLNEQRQLMERQAALVGETISAFEQQQAEIIASRDIFESQQITLAENMKTLITQTQAANTEAETRRKLIAALAKSAENQQEQSDILAEGVALDKAASLEENFVDVLIAESLECVITKSGRPGYRGSRHLILDSERSEFIAAQQVGTFRVTSILYAALLKFHVDLKSTVGDLEFWKKWDQGGAQSCSAQLGIIQDKISEFSAYLMESKYSVIQNRSGALKLGSLVTTLREIKKTLDEIAASAQRENTTEK